METIKILNKYFSQIKTEIEEIKENNDPKFVFKKDVQPSIGRRLARVVRIVLGTSLAFKLLLMMLRKRLL